MYSDGKLFLQIKKHAYICNRKRQNNAEIAQLVEHDLAKVGVASSSLVFRSKPLKKRFFFSPRFYCRTTANVLLQRPDGGIGRHPGLKILCPLRTCGFKSRSGYLTLQKLSVDQGAFFLLIANSRPTNLLQSRPTSLL